MSYFIKPKEPENMLGTSAMTKPPVNIDLVKFFHCENITIRVFMEEDVCKSIAKTVYIIHFIYVDKGTIEWRFDNEEERDTCYARMLEKRVGII